MNSISLHLPSFEYPTVVKSLASKINVDKITQVAKVTLCISGVVFLSLSYIAIGYVFPIASAVIYAPLLLASAAYILVDKQCISNAIKRIGTTGDETQLIENLQKVSKHIDRLKVLNFLAAISLYSPPVFLTLVYAPVIGWICLGMVGTAILIHAIVGLKLTQTDENFKEFISPVLKRMNSTTLEKAEETIDNVHELQRIYKDTQNNPNKLLHLLYNERLGCDSRKEYQAYVRKMLSKATETVLRKNPGEYPSIEVMDFDALKKIFNFAVFDELSKPSYKFKFFPPTLHRKIFELGDMRTELEKFSPQEISLLKEKLYNIDFECTSKITNLSVQISNFASIRMQSQIIKNNPTIFIRAALRTALKTLNLRLGKQAFVSAKAHYVEQVRQFLKKDLLCRVD